MEEIGKLQRIPLLAAWHGNNEIYFEYLKKAQTNQTNEKQLFHLLSPVRFGTVYRIGGHFFTLVDSYFSIESIMNTSIKSG